ncbi:FAD-dependent oxidoreductase [Marinobacterium aestuariivivens]|uniref:FAD-dependent oxidoreductase n=1 Tax=Marinobacterium aestuariivivens TaxID=1698799 RepID=A0ABW1ZUS7_9GAMM
MNVQALRPLKIAVVGSGISGLSCAWLLSRQHQVTLFEKDDRLGGHSNTVELDLDGRQTPVDTGFIVYNPVNYPNLVRLFETLGSKAAPPRCPSRSPSTRAAWSTAVPGCRACSPGAATC